MIKAIFTALTGIDESIDSQDSQASWEQQKYLDDNDLDDPDEADADADDDGSDRKAWWQVW